MSKILVIDDSEEFREVIQELLLEEGHDVSVAGSADQGLRMCELETFDLVFCDLVLPSDAPEDELFPDEENDSAMIGVHAIHNLAKNFPEMPIVAVSGQLTGAPLKALERYGAKKCLSKPFGRDVLLATVNELL